MPAWGVYTVRVEAAGFATLTRKAQLSAESASLTLRLDKVSAVSEEVFVTGDLSKIDMASPDPSQKVLVREELLAALRDAGTALDGAKPGALRDLSAALRYEPAVYDAMTQMRGPTRTTLLVASLAHEDRVRREPRIALLKDRVECGRRDEQHTELLAQRFP